MKDYLNYANGGLVYLLAGVVILVVMVQSVVFLRIALKRGKEIGMEKSTMVQAIKSSAVFSIVPSLPIVISLIAIAPVLGTPFSWLRLSVIGSNSYELIAANAGANAMGLESINDVGYDAVVFSNSMWVMTLGIIWGLLACIFILKRYQKAMKNVQKKDSIWAEIMINALFFGMISVFLGRPFASGGIGLYVLLSSAAIMLGLTHLSKKMNIKWLADFALSVSMIAGMALAILFSNIG
ncbi:MAG: DUF5058 family protein [Vallitaleaceae bacterium]|jgi:hypothetical protein|nr:DUF5058 family protein [Vallitaleaceae bacterium]